MVAIQLYQRLKDLHSIGVIHNDIKPDNILVDKQTGGIVHFIDFGLSQYYIEKNEAGVIVHKQRKYLNTFTGNFIFASLNSLQGFSKSRKDDLESVYYMIIFLLNKNNLPWMYLCQETFPFNEKVKMRFDPSQ
jgi:serine/threonine protein kinase